MKNQDYKKTFTSDVNSKKAFANIVDVSGWWTNSFKGSAMNSGDEFEVNFSATWVKFKVVESIPYEKLTWLVTSCNLDWINNKTEWKGTKLLWEIFPGNGETEISMTHIGLIPAAECYKDCRKGWNFYIEKSLYRLLTENKGLPDQE